MRVLWLGLAVWLAEAEAGQLRPRDLASLATEAVEVGQTAVEKCPRLAVPVLLASETHCELFAERDVASDCVLRYEKRCDQSVASVPKAARQSVNLPLSQESGKGLARRDFLARPLEVTPGPAAEPASVPGTFSGEVVSECGAVEPPVPKAGCYWVPMRDETGRCLVEYEERCRPVPGGCEAIARPVGRKGCDVVSLHDPNGCISSFRCEPSDCIRIEEPEALFACVWFPVRDSAGCTVSFDCLPGAQEAAQLSLPVDGPDPLFPVSGGEDDGPVELPIPGAAAKTTSFTGAIVTAPVDSDCPEVARPGNVKCPLVGLTDERGCIVGFDCAPTTKAPLKFSAEGAPVPTTCPFLQTPPPVPGCTWEAKRDALSGCVTEHNLLCQKPRLPSSRSAGRKRPVGCPAVRPPQLVGSFGDCQLKTLHDRNGCVAEFRCVRPDKVCPDVIEPDEVPGCVWEPIKDASACVTAFQCNPTPSNIPAIPTVDVSAEVEAKCGPEPAKPDSQGRCNWLPIRDNNGCTVDYQCEILPQGDLAGVVTKLGEPIGRSKSVVSLVGPQPVVSAGSGTAGKVPSRRTRVEPVKVERVERRPAVGSFFTLAPAIPTAAPQPRLPLATPAPASAQTFLGAECGPPPTKPLSRGLCEWTPIRDAKLCVVNYECRPQRSVPVRRPPASVAERRARCPQAPKRPRDNAFCRWAPEKDRRGCLLNFRCQRRGIAALGAVERAPTEPIARSGKVPCGKAPARPQSVLGCSWQPVRGPDQCLIDWQCEPSETGTREPKRSRAETLEEVRLFPPVLKRGLGRAQPPTPAPTGAPRIERLDGPSSPFPQLPDRLAVPTSKTELFLVTRPPAAFFRFTSPASPASHTPPTSATATPSTTPPTPPTRPSTVGTPGTTTQGWLVTQSPTDFIDNLAIGQNPRELLRQQQTEGSGAVELPRSSIPCPPEPTKPADTRRCAYVPLRDEQGCVLNYHCQRRTSVPKLVCRSVFFGAKQICELEAESVAIDEEGGVPPAEGLVPERRASRSQRVEIVELDQDLQQARARPRVRATELARLAAAASTREPRTESPAQSLPRSSVSLARHASTTERPEKCRRRSRPIRPQPSPSCNWVQIKDQEGCTISYRCVPKSQAQQLQERQRERTVERVSVTSAGRSSLTEAQGFTGEAALGRAFIGPQPPPGSAKGDEDDDETPNADGTPKDCRVTPVAPKDSKRCRWVAIRDSRNCIIDFECEPVPASTTTRAPCAEEPPKPRPSPTCDWTPARDGSGCVRKWNCQRFCEDVAPRYECFHWSRQGLCFHNTSFMSNNCQRTCGFCGPDDRFRRPARRNAGLSQFARGLRRARGRDAVDDYES